MNYRALSLLCLLAASAIGLSAESFSYTGTLNSPESVFETTFNLAAAGSVTLQTWGFGGGTNAAGQVIAPGGFDPLLTLFSGPVGTATIVTDGSGNPLADADNLSNAPWSYVNNPAAGEVAIGPDLEFGDDFMQTPSLAAGTYTLVLSDAGYQPAAIYDGGALSEGFFDLTGGVFQTCESTTNCISPSGNYAVDIITPRVVGTQGTPEPPPLPLLLTGLALLAGFGSFNQRRTAPHTQKGAAE
jgi:hypothetical protein